MKVTYFPYTIVQPSALKSLSACFSNLILYQLSDAIPSEGMREGVERGVFKIRFQGQEMHRKLISVWNDFESWAKLHQTPRDLKTIFFKGLKDRTPFFNETATARIASEIKHHGLEENCDKSASLIFSSVFFLYIAEKYDSQSWDIETELESFEDMEQNMIKNLKGGEEDENKFAPDRRDIPADNPCDHMIPERISAWIHLFLDDIRRSGEPMPAVYVTSNPLALEHVLDKADQWEHAFEINGIPTERISDERRFTWQRSLMNRLSALADHSNGSLPEPTLSPPYGTTEDASVSLSAYRIQESPWDFFVRFIDSGLYGELKKIKKTPGPNHTVVVLLNRSSERIPRSLLRG
ncbi:MAG: hypothetical protein V1714_02445 [Pseudomonadota bacterium]